MDKKTLAGRIEIKSESKGEITAVFSTLGVVDKDGDITVKGAMKDGAPVRLSAYNHKSWEGALPVGKGVIREVGNEVVFEGQFFMNTTHGRDTFETVKAMGELQEFSYGFDVVDSEEPDQEQKSAGARRILKSLAVHEVSPVLLGAGVGTRTVGVKGEKKTFAEELTEVVASVKAVRERAAEVMAMRAEKGKGLGEESQDNIVELVREIRELSSILDDSFAKNRGEGPNSEVKDEDLESANKELRAAFMRFMQSNSEGS